MFSRVGRYWDWFQLQWSEWIINYDFVHQVTLAQNLQRVSRDWTERLRKSFADARRLATDRLELWQSRAIHTAGFLPASFAILAGLSIFVLLLQPNVRQRLMTLWHLRVSTSTAMTPHLATLQYNEMLRLLSRRGIRKAPGQTPLEFAGSVPDGNLAEPVHELTAMYHAARFGGQASDPRGPLRYLPRFKHAFSRSSAGGEADRGRQTPRHARIILLPAVAGPRFMPKAGFISLGCPKNLVDSEVMMGILARHGYEFTPRAEEAEVLVVNTCSFIAPAQKESIDTILEMAEYKKFGAAKN